MVFDERLHGAVGYSFAEEKNSRRFEVLGVSLVVSATAPLVQGALVTQLPTVGHAFTAKQFATPPATLSAVAASKATALGTTPTAV